MSSDHSAQIRWLIKFLKILLILGLAALPAQAAVLKLSGTMPAFGDVQDFQISSNGQYIVYKADQDTDYRNEIYSVPITGGTPVRLNVPPEPPFQVGSYAISPDSQWVVYIVPPQSGLGFATSAELFRVLIDGSGASIKLNSTLVSGGNVMDFRISTNSGRVVYRADQDMDQVFELYSVPLDGSAPLAKLNKPLVAEGDVSTEFQINANGSRVLYIADQDTDEVYELYSVPLAGPASSGVKLNGSLVSGGDVGAPIPFQISADSSRAVYLADQETDGVAELYSVPIDGSASSAKLNSPFPSGTGFPFLSLQISYDSSRVVYVAKQESATHYDLYSVPLTGPADAKIKLNDPGIDSDSIAGAAVTRDSARVVYYISSSGFRIYSVPITGPSSAGVNLASGTEPFQISPNSRYIVYYSSSGIFSVPVEGPSSAAIQLATPPLGGYLGYRISPDSSRVVYLALPNGPNELYSVATTSPYSDSIKISGTLVAGGNVQYYSGFQFSPDGSRVVYRADQDTDEVIELYVTDEGQISSKVYLPLVQR